MRLFFLGFILFVSCSILAQQMGVDSTALSETNKEQAVETTLAAGFEKEKAVAETGDVKAQAAVAFTYRFGLAITAPNDFEAAKWYLRAAKQGDGESQMSIGQMYEYGEGVRQNYIEAYKWLNIASTSTERPKLPAGVKSLDELPPLMREGYRTVGERAKEMRDSLTPLMTPEQIAEAQQLSANFVPRKEAPGSNYNSSSPVAESPIATGTGFFITEDGYLVISRETPVL